MTSFPTSDELLNSPSFVVCLRRNKKRFFYTRNLLNKAGFKNSHDKIDWVKENDPNMFALAQRYFPTEPWDYCSDVEY